MGRWEHEATCIWCNEMIAFADFDTPDECPHCRQALEWDWYDDSEGRGPLYHTLKPATSPDHGVTPSGTR